MKKLWARKNAGLVFMAFALTFLLPGARSAFAHGGEDHGDQKAPVVSAGAGLVTRVARAGDFEVTIKHPPIEPDKGITARVFVTRFETNEAIEKAQVSVLLGDGGSIPEVMAIPSSTPGMYEIKLPPLPKGRYKLTARLSVNGSEAATSTTAQFGSIEIAPAPPSAVESKSSWARTALIGLAILIGLGAAGMIIYRIVQSSRRDRIKGEPVAA